MRLVILNPGVRPKFQGKISIFPGKECMKAPLFIEETLHRGGSKNSFIFPLAVLPLDILPPN